jgi:uncharacterized protein (DUF433 family)
MATLYGVVHGKTIELNEAPGLPDGQAVAVTLERVAPANSATNREQLPHVEDWIDRLVFDSSITSGGRVVKGTRLSAEILVREMANGRPDQEMLASHPELTPEDMAALRQYARLPQAFRLTFGAWAEDSEQLDRYVESLRERHRRGRPEIAP